MPFRHVALFRWAAHVDADHVQRVRDAFDELAERVSVRHHVHGSDVGVAEGTFDYLVVADFDTVEHWRAYRDHPTHVLLVEELIVGHAVERAGGQFQTPDERSAHEVAMGTRPSLLAEDESDPFAAADDMTDDMTDDEILERARRAAMAEMQTLLAEPTDD